MHYKLIGCKIFEREIASVIYQCKNKIDLTLLRQKLHDRPQNLKEIIQAEIDAIDADSHRYSNTTTYHPFDAVLLSYGLCSGATTGLSSKKYPLVIPRVHDCISLFMGDRKKYEEYYKKHPGTFYYTPGFVECADALRLDNQWEQVYLFYLKRHNGNEKKAKMLVEIEKGLTENYNSLTYIRWNELSFPEYEEKVLRMAEEKHWAYDLVAGNNTLLKKLVDGEWDEKNFLVVPPNCCAVESYDEEIMKLGTGHF
jgi:Protein of unknown function (DUF1638).